MLIQPHCEVPANVRWELEAKAWFAAHENHGWYFRELYPGERTEIAESSELRRRIIEALDRALLTVDGDMVVCIFPISEGYFRMPVIRQPDGTHTFVDLNEKGDLVAVHSWNLVLAVRERLKAGAPV